MKHAYSFPAILALLAAAPLQAQSADKGVFFTGLAVSDGISAYAGAMTSLPGARLGKGLGVRGSVNAGRYHYDRNGTDIKADYVGGEAALVYQMSGPWGWANVSAGPRVTDVSLSPEDPTNERQGTRFDVGVGSDGALNADAWRLGWFGSYGVIDEAYQLQLRAGYRVAASRDAYFGVEGGLQGDPTYDSRSAGLFYSSNIGGKWNGQISGGVTDQEGRKAKAYVAIGLSRLF